jgi:hypothetical protein
MDEDAPEPRPFTASTARLQMAFDNVVTGLATAVERGCGDSRDGARSAAQLAAARTDLQNACAALAEDLVRNNRCMHM